MAISDKVDNISHQRFAFSRRKSFVKESEPSGAPRWGLPVVVMLIAASTPDG